MSTSPLRAPAQGDRPQSPKQDKKQKYSYSGDFWTAFFNGKNALSEAFKKEHRLQGGVPAHVLGRPHVDTPENITKWVNLNVGHIRYFSYRNRLPVPLSNGLDHDAGWGCMIRTGQMMLCEAVKRVLPDDLARSCGRLFMDLPDAPFGLHHMTDRGAKAHIPVGQWFNPTALAFTLKGLVAACPMTADRLAVVVGRDTAVRREDITDELVEGRHVLLVVPVMLGTDKMNPDYVPAVLKTFELPCTMGIVGGRPKHSLYFVGAQNDTVFYLDPHTVQSAYISDETGGNTCGARGNLAAAELDPSMLLCFLLAKRADLEDFERAFTEVINKLSEYPMFSIVQPKPKPGAKPSSSAAATAARPAASSPPQSSSPMAHPQATDDVDDCAYDSGVEDEMASLGPSPTSPSPTAASAAAAAAPPPES